MNKEYEINKNWILGAIVVILTVIGIYSLLSLPSTPTSTSLVPNNNSSSSSQRAPIGYSATPSTISSGPVKGFYDEVVPQGMRLGARRGEYIWEKDNSVMVYVTAGPFTMGDNYIPASRPVHRVTLTGYYIDKYEVTWAQFKAYCKATGKKPPQQPQWVTDDYPVVNVTWYDANDYATWVGKSMPTEAQWEKAARGGVEIPEMGGSSIPIIFRTNPWPVRIYPWGNGYPNAGGSYRCNYRADNNVDSQGKDGYKFAAPVGSFATHEGSIYGCCDLIGNVNEWCQDYYKFQYDPKNNTNPRGPTTGDTKVTRGGGWNTDAQGCRLGNRAFSAADHKNDTLGFRLVKNAQ